MDRWPRIEISTLVILAAVLMLVRQAYYRRPPLVYFVDPGSRPFDRLEAGSLLQVGLLAIGELSHYQLRLTISEAGGEEDLKTVSLAHIATYSAGVVRPFVLRYQSGGFGCSQRLRPDDELPAFTYRPFNQDEEEFAGRQLTASVYRAAERRKRGSSGMKRRNFKADCTSRQMGGTDAPMWLEGSNDLQHILDSKSLITRGALANRANENWNWR